MNLPITVLAIESSCDETAACVLRLKKDNRAEILADHVASQDEVHAPHGGVVPELASRQHLQVLAPMVRETLHESGIVAADLDGIVATSRPGLLGSLLVGLSFAKSYAWTLDKPFIGVSHLEGHLNAPFLEYPDIPYPHTALMVSGGHTALYHCRDFGDCELIGATRDDAAGEAFDKVAKLLGLGYPGGPIIDRIARQGNPNAHNFPRGSVRGRPLFLAVPCAAVLLILVLAGSRRRCAITSKKNAAGGPSLATKGSERGRLHKVSLWRGRREPLLMISAPHSRKRLSTRLLKKQSRPHRNLRTRRFCSPGVSPAIVACEQNSKKPPKKKTSNVLYRHTSFARITPR
jgi:hypothetical protein